MKKITSFLFALALGLGSLAEGSLAPCEGELVFAAEYLYFVPLIDRPTYVLKTSASGSNVPVREINNTFHADNGWRILALFDCCSTFDCQHIFGGSWTYFSSSHRESYTSAGLGLIAVDLPGSVGCTLPLVPFSGEATSCLDLTYNDAEFVLDMLLCGDYCFQIFVQGGVQFLSLDYCQEAAYFQSVAPISNYLVKNHSCQLGAGLKGGLDVTFCLPRCFCTGDLTFHAKVTGGLILANNKSSYRFSEDVTPCDFKVRNESFTHFVPASELKFGINYVLPFSSSTFALEAGYNLLYYRNVFDKIEFPNSLVTDPGRSVDQYSDLGLHGLYAGLGISF